MSPVCRNGRRDPLDIVEGIICSTEIGDTKKHYRRYVDLLVSRGLIRVGSNGRIIVSEKGRLLIEKIKCLKNIFEEGHSSGSYGKEIGHVDPYMFREIYIGCLSGGKARSKYDIIACILACGLKGSSRVHILETCSLNTIQFRKYLKMLLVKKMVYIRKLSNGRTVIQTTDLGRRYLESYTHIINILRQ